MIGIASLHWEKDRQQGDYCIAYTLSSPGIMQLPFPRVGLSALQE